MNFRIDNIDYTVLECTAIALCDNGDVTKNQKALVIYSDNGTETEKHVVFGWKLPETQEDMKAMFEDYSAWEIAEKAHKIVL